jgi:hypothetical protein
MSPLFAGPGFTAQPGPARRFITWSAWTTHWALPSWRCTESTRLRLSPNSCSETSPSPRLPTVERRLLEMDVALLGAHLDRDAALEIDAEIEAEHEHTDQRQHVDYGRQHEREPALARKSKLVRCRMR